MHVAQRFERFLETYRRPDGRRWGGAELQKATGGIVTCSYVTNQKMRAIAKAMGFPPEVWFEEDLGSEGGSPAKPEGRGIPGRIEHLFEVVKNPKTGESYTNAEVACMSAGEITRRRSRGSGPGGSLTPKWVGWRPWRQHSAYRPPTC